MSDPILKVRRLEAWYGESQALHGIDLEVFEGETVAILGRNGAGKTTLLKSIVGIVGQRKGEVRLKGRDMLRVPLHRVASLGLGYVPEERGIFADLNVLENLLLPPVFSDKGFSVDELFALFPNLHERRDSPGTRLSGGEQQMLAIARVLRAGADIVLLDEPTEGLAPVIVQRIGEIVRLLKQRKVTVVLVEQNFRFASRLADRFYVFADGRVLESFAAREIDRHQALLDAVLGV